MEDCLTRQVASLSRLEKELLRFIEIVSSDSSPEDSDLESVSRELDDAAKDNELFGAEFVILKKEWDLAKERIDATDRTRIGELGARAKAVSFTVTSLYNDAAERATSLAEVDKSSLATLQRGSSAIHQYRVDDDRSSFDTQA